MDISVATRLLSQIMQLILGGVTMNNNYNGKPKPLKRHPYNYLPQNSDLIMEL